MPNIPYKYNALFAIFFAAILIVAGIVNVIFAKKNEASQKLNLEHIVEEVNNNIYIPPETPFFIDKTLDYYEEILGYTQSWPLYTNYLHRLTEGGRYEEVIQFAQDIAKTAEESEFKKYIYPILIVNYIKLGLKENCACNPCNAPLNNYTFSKLTHFQKAYELLSETKSLHIKLLSGYFNYQTSTLYTWKAGKLLTFLEKVLQLNTNASILPQKQVLLSLPKRAVL